MPVYNAKAYVAEALESVLQQTYRDFELLVIDDGSTDDTRAIIERADDPRVSIAANDMNLGVVATLKKGLALSRGDFIARMDADDISEPDRFAKQRSYLESHPDVDIVGGAIQYFGNIRRPHTVVFPTEHEDIRVALLFYCPLAHPAVMFRRSLVTRNLLQYSEEFRHAEDYHLWSELLQHARAANLSDLVLRYRLHGKQVRYVHGDPQYEVSARVRKSLLSRGGVNWSEEEIELHETIASGQYRLNPAYLNRVGRWFDRIEQSNRATRFWEPRALHRSLAKKLVEVALRMGMGPPARSLDDLARSYLDEAGFRPEKTIMRIQRRAKNLARRILVR